MASYHWYLAPDWSDPEADLDAGEDLGPFPGTSDGGSLVKWNRAGMGKHCRIRARRGSPNDDVMVGTQAGLGANMPSDWSHFETLSAARSHYQTATGHTATQAEEVIT